MNQPKLEPAAARHGRPAVFTRLVATALLALAAITTASAQGADDAAIRELVARLDRGETEAVRQQLPELVAKYQNHPGILFVQARVATDGIEAAKLYQSVLDNYPASEWADDALFNLYQYYYAMGLYMTAELRMQQLRKDYPNSEHLAVKSAPPAGTDTLRKTTVPPASPPVAADTPKTDPPAAPPSREVAAGAAVTPNDTSTGGAMPYTLQTGAFSTSENAQKQKAWFEELGYSAEITNRVRSGKSLYLVWVGSFANTTEARKVLKDIQSRYNITPIVVER